MWLPKEAGVVHSLPPKQETGARVLCSEMSRKLRSHNYQTQLLMTSTDVRKCVQLLVHTLYVHTYVLCCGH